MNEGRPRPEDFLELVERAKRGRLKIYIGAAAGVGKTYQMLEEAHVLKKRGVDVVLAFIEPHGRAGTAARIQGVEVIPRRRCEYRVVSLDLAVEDLLDRLREGKVYSADKIPWALAHFFKPENLSVLREIALREVAESIDRTVTAQIPVDEVARKAAASNRVMVCLAAYSPHVAALLLRGSRMDVSLNTDW